MKLQDIYRYFQEPPPIYLSKEVAVCYVASVLTQQGDSYGTALIQFVETKHPHFRLSDTVLYSALKFLVQERLIRGYWQKVEGRGRPRRMYQICTTKLEQARNLALLWHNYLYDNQGLTQAGQLKSG